MRLCLNHNNFFGPCLGYEWLSNAKNYSNIFQLLHIMSDMLFHVFPNIWPLIMSNSMCHACINLSYDMYHVEA